MAAYSVEYWNSSIGTMEEVSLEMYTEINGIDSAKVLRSIGISQVAGSAGKFQAWLIYDA